MEEQLEVQSLERGTFGLNPDGITYQICALDKFINLSVLIYSSIQWIWFCDD